VWGEVGGKKGWTALIGHPELAGWDSSYAVLDGERGDDAV